MVNNFKDRISKRELCHWLSLPESVFYYRPTTGKRGVRPSTHTSKKDGSVLSNELVIQDIKKALGREFCCYGYHNITDDLRDLDYIINHKKVYRLMSEHELLLGKVIRTSGKRTFVKHRRIEAQYPMEYLCLDIKYVWIEGEKRNYYLLTILDIFTRKAIRQIFQRSIRKIDVINLFRSIDRQYGIKGVTVRNDNGSQFIANDVKQYLRSAEVNQEFTHIATPQENAYIEAFHSIVDREVIQRFEFNSYYEAKLTFEAHLHWYNTVRKHGQINRMPPQRKWDLYAANLANKTTNLAQSGEEETGSAGEQPVRNIPTNGDNQEEMANTISSDLELSLLPMSKKTHYQKEEIDLNSSR
jgi:transposase InsO family protein